MFLCGSFSYRNYDRADRAESSQRELTHSRINTLQKEIEAGTASTYYALLRRCSVGSGDTPETPQARTQRKARRYCEGSQSRASKPKSKSRSVKNIPNYVSVRIKPVRTSKACQQVEHDSRYRPPTYLKTSNVDSEIYLWGTDKHGRMTGDAETLKAKNENNENRRANAREMIKQSAKEQADRYRENVGRSPQTNANWFITGVITFSPEGFPKEGTDKRDDFEKRLWEHAKNYIEDLCKMLNANPVYMSLHRDETTPHFHFQLENSDKDNGKSISRKIKPKDCSKMQDLAGEEFADMGFVRGESRDSTGATHKSVRESHRIEQKKLEKETQDTLDRKAKAEDEEREINDRIAQIRRETLPELMEQLINLQRQKQDLTKELQDAKDKLTKTNKQNLEAQEKAEEIKKKLDAANEEAESNKGLLKLYDNHVELKEKVERYERFLQEKGLTEEFENWAVDYMNAKNEDFEDFETEIVSDQFDYSFDR